MAMIGEEIGRSLVSTNVTDNTELMPLSTRITCGNSFTAFIDDNDEARIAGLFLYNKYVAGGTLDASLNIINSKSIDVTSSGSIKILKYDGTLEVVGENGYGNLGIGNTTTQYSFQTVPLTDIIEVSGNEFFTTIIKEDRSIWISGTIAGGTTTNVFTDTTLRNGDSMASGTDHTMLVKQDGTLWAIGSNTDGRCGLGATSSVAVFTNTGLTNVKKVVSFSSHTFAIKNDGTLWATGLNTTGQLGLGDITTRTTFTQVSVTGIIDVACGDSASGNHFSLLVKSDGTLWATGDGLNGEFGTGVGYGTYSTSFFDTGITNVQSVTAGVGCSFIVKTDGHVWSTGSDQYGKRFIYTFTDDVFTETSKITTLNGFDEHIEVLTGETRQQGDYLYYITNIGGGDQSVFYSKSNIGYINHLKPFDDVNITPATHDGTVSDMDYVVKSTSEFNAFTLSKVLASSVTYTFTLPTGHADYALWLNGVAVASGGNGITKTGTTTIDCSRDALGILSDYPTTIAIKCDTQMPADSTITIALTYDGTISLGDLTLNNMISQGITNLQFSHGIQDFNNYTPDAWGNIPEGVKAVVTKFNITVDVIIDDYDKMVSLNESLVRKNVTIDGSDSVDGSTTNVFNSLTRRARITNVSSKTVVTDGALDGMCKLTLSAQEIV